MTDDSNSPVTNTSTELAVLAARAADAKGATDVVVIEVGDVLGICEYFVVATASNSRLVRAVVDAVEHEVKTQLGRSHRGTEGASEKRWVLMDFGDVVLHVFDAEEREYYRIERLYSDAPTVDWAASGTPA